MYFGCPDHISGVIIDLLSSEHIFIQYSSQTALEWVQSLAYNRSMYIYLGIKHIYLDTTWINPSPLLVVQWWQDSTVMFDHSSAVKQLDHHSLLIYSFRLRTGCVKWHRKKAGRRQESFRNDQCLKVWLVYCNKSLGPP